MHPRNQFKLKLCNAKIIKHLLYQGKSCSNYVKDTKETINDFVKVSFLYTRNKARVKENILINVKIINYSKTIIKELKLPNLKKQQRERMRKMQ